MSSVSTPVAVPSEATHSSTRVVPALLVSAGTVLVILAGSLALLLQPFYLHAALAAARSAAATGLTQAEANQLSDRTVEELIRGPGTFAFPDPAGARFYDPSEAAHMQDVRLVLARFMLLALVLGALGLLVLLRERREPWAWRAVAAGAAGLALTLFVVGAVALLAFDSVFELFHRTFFPGGNYSFDPARQRLVQLYPTSFWQLTSAALAGLVIAGGLLVAWWAGRRARALGRARS